ncbi:MAG: hypothetical protein JXA73_10625 [Acidobacteria bacterium]|nr:hypothetical protein [Acidobacteriota bacterium]
MIRIGILILFSVQVFESSPAPVLPEAAGIYFRQNDAWIRLQPAIVSGASASGMELFVYTGAYTDMSMSITCPGPRASVRIQQQKPTLFVRGIGAARDAMLVRLKKKKDSRVLKSAFSNVTVENKGGFIKKDIYKLIIAEYPDGSFSASPEKRLPAGEYLLVFGNAPTVYDFGVNK